MCELENTEGTGISQPWRDNCMSSLMWAKKKKIGQTHRGTDRVKIMVAKGWKCPKGKMLAQVSVFSYAWWVSSGDAMYSLGFISKQCCTLHRFQLFSLHTQYTQRSSGGDRCVNYLDCIFSKFIHFPTHRVAHLNNILFVFANYIQIKTKK